MISVLGFKRIVLGVLAVLLIGIWIRNLLLLVPTNETGETPEVPGTAAGVSDLPAFGFEDTAFTLDPNIRDPFLLPRNQLPKNSSRSTIVQVARPVESIRASLKGHVFSNAQSYVLAIDSLTGRIALYRVGDSLNGFYLDRISRTDIQWKTKRGHRLVWKANT